LPPIIKAEVNIFPTVKKMRPPLLLAGLLALWSCVGPSPGTVTQPRNPSRQETRLQKDDTMVREKSVPSPEARIEERAKDSTPPAVSVSEKKDAPAPSLSSDSAGKEVVTHRPPPPGAEQPRAPERSGQAAIPDQAKTPGVEEPPRETLPYGKAATRTAAARSVKTDQQILDSALEFCQASNDFWEQGDLENALAALDKAYSLILQVNGEVEPQIAQQRDDLRFTISKRIIEVYASRVTVVNGDHKAIPLVMNRHVERALRLFKGKDRTFFLNAYRRSGRYRPAIVRALKKAGLPEELSWLPLIESGFKIRALSRARALGLWQFIASTGYKFGLKRDRYVDERMDPEKSTRAAIAYLKELHGIFGDWTTALAAYNCGEGTVLKRIRRQRVSYLDNFWDLYETLPMETAFYVPKFLAVLHILQAPEAHGFTLPEVDEEVRYEEVVVNRPVHLRTLAKHLSVSYDLLKNLNPALKRYFTPNRPYAVRVPLGKGEMLRASLAKIPTWKPPVPEYVVHRVRSGESLSVLARRYRTSVRAIMRLNGLRSRHYIKAGWKLKIPTRRYAARSRPTAGVTVTRSGPPPSRYVVRKGDSLWLIAQRFGTTTQAIQLLNGLTDTHLRIGQVLRISGGQTDVSAIRTKPYVVLQGDSPYMIALKNQMSLSEFLRLNGLTPRSTIFPGQTLLVKAE